MLANLRRQRMGDAAAPSAPCALAAALAAGRFGGATLGPADCALARAGASAATGAARDRALDCRTACHNALADRDRLRLWRFCRDGERRPLALGPISERLGLAKGPVAGSCRAARCALVDLQRPRLRNAARAAWNPLGWIGRCWWSRCSGTWYCTEPPRPGLQHGFLPRYQRRALRHARRPWRRLLPATSVGCRCCCCPGRRCDRRVLATARDRQWRDPAVAFLLPMGRFSCSRCSRPRAPLPHMLYWRRSALLMASQLISLAASAALVLGWCWLRNWRWPPPCPRCCCWRPRSGDDLGARPVRDHASRRLCCRWRTASATACSCWRARRAAAPRFDFGQHCARRCRAAPSRCCGSARSSPWVQGPFMVAGVWRARAGLQTVVQWQMHQPSLPTTVASRAAARSAPDELPSLVKVNRIRTFLIRMRFKQRGLLIVRRSRSRSDERR